jgi:hypothetical protein
MPYRGGRIVRLVLLPLIGALWAAPALGQSVITLPVPEGGRLPQAVVDSTGTVHLVYTVGDVQHGDLMHATRAPGAARWSNLQRVNSAPGTVTGFGPVDGGQLALGPDDRLHIAWFRISPPAFFYTRSNEEGPGFEAQFGVATGDGVEAGPAVAAGPDGNVYLFWHSGAVEDAQRALYMVVSRDGGLIFEPSLPVNTEAAGACACCRPAALTDDASAIYVSYRGAGDNVRRGQRLLVSRDGGTRFSDELIQPWNVGACPVATTSLSPGPTGMTVAWETQGQVYFAAVDRFSDPVSPPGEVDARRKNPAVAVNHRGETLLAWADASGLRTGGTLHWQLFDPAGRPTAARGGGALSLPEGSVPFALAQPDGTFVVVY